MKHIECKTLGDNILFTRACGARTRILILVALSMVVAVPGLWAQTTATIQGTITSPNNPPLQGVQVSVTGDQGARTVVTDQKGFYLIPNLPPGIYRLTASLRTFAPGEAEKIELRPDQTLTLNISLQSLAFAEAVEVTSQKRTETLQKIPASITVLSEDKLQQEKVENLLDFVPLVPGLIVESDTPGTTRLTIRGINTGGIASTVGVYLDDMPFGSSSGMANGAVLAGDFDTFDVARIEVLRGPQGTLYGASSLAGVVKYIMNPPNTKAFDARLLGSSETVENGNLGYSLKAMANVPVSDQFAVRASGFYRSDDGFIDSIGNNPIASLTTPGVNIIDGTLVKKDINSLDT